MTESGVLKELLKRRTNVWSYTELLIVSIVSMKAFILSARTLYEKSFSVLGMHYADEVMSIWKA